MVARGTDQSDGSVLRSAPLLVGRAGEQVFLREELAAALGGHGRLVLLGGAAGIGKTMRCVRLRNAAPASSPAPATT